MTGTFTANSLRYIEPGAMVRFVTDDINTAHFNEAREIALGSSDPAANQSASFGASDYLWTRVVSVDGDGTEVSAITGQGPIVFSDNIPTNAVLDRIVPNFSRVLVDSVKSQMIDQCFQFKDFGLRYDLSDRQWKIITNENINTLQDFSTGKTGDATGQNLDSSWFLYFKTDGERYTITYRNLRYVFESADEIKFYFDGVDKVYNPATGKIVRDKIDVLNINTQQTGVKPFNSDFTWTISNAYRDPDGYIDSRKIEIQFMDIDDDGNVDNPEIFDQLIDPDNASVATSKKTIFQKKYTTSDGVEDFKYFSNDDQTITIVTNESGIAPYSSRTEGQIFYLEDEKVFKTLNKSLNNTTLNTDYKLFTGRDGLKFHYTHVADSSYRIDPSSTNIIDTYLLTKAYDENIRKFISGEINVQPLPQSNDELFRNYGSAIDKIKSISCLLYTSPSPRDATLSRMPSSA